MYDPVEAEVSARYSECNDDDHQTTAQATPRHSNDKPHRNNTAERQPKNVAHNPISWTLKLFVATSLLALLVAVVFISWLWWTPRDNPSWRSWVLIPNRLQLSVTIAAVAIRTAVGVMAASATAMIASVIVERRGVSIQNVAQLPITRFTSSGPLSLANVVIQDPVIQVTARAAIVFLILTTVALQFTSSFLTADFQPHQIVSFTQEVPNAYKFGTNDSTPYTLSSLNYGLSNGYLEQRPHLSQSFAEYSEPPQIMDGLDDTGINIRAFLPMASQTRRELLFEFKGMSRVFDSRVVCIRPQILELGPCYPISNITNIRGICGSVQVGRDVARSC